MGFSNITEYKAEYTGYNTLIPMLVNLRIRSKLNSNLKSKMLSMKYASKRIEK